MSLIVILFAVGMLLSAYFSGTETGFYRASRIRLLLDGLGGDVVARLLLRLTNNPTLFVATTLVGNNLANYLVSLSIVLATERFPVSESFVASLVAPVVFAPFVFVYGELLPKNLFYHMPNRLLRAGAPAFFFFALLFLPLAAILWIFGRILGRVVGESPERVRLMLARHELARVLEEGHHAGILRPVQRDLAQGLFSVANYPVSRFAIPTARMVAVRLGASKTDVLRLARRQRAGVLPVESDKKPRRIVGYVRTFDLQLHQGDWTEQTKPLLEIQHSQTLIDAMIRMQNSREPLARVVDAEGRTTGLLSARRVRESLFRPA
jgi:CBS domain containing-hemolysin-like protein